METTDQDLKIEIIKVYQHKSPDTVRCELAAYWLLCNHITQKCTLESF